ncbi:MAG: PhoX family protein [Rhizobium sp.]|nr:PhoX family protein [Rhizobium sp.]
MSFHESTPLISRRRLLQGSLGLGAAALGLSPVGRLLAQAGHTNLVHPGYGPLAPVKDLATGLPLLQLPQGFSYTSFGWESEALSDGRPCPGKHDGMGVVGAEGSVITLVRNHEVKYQQVGSFAPAEATYDPDCAGGTVTLRFDTARGELVEARPSLSGTLVNCAGGATPWGTWLSCEEIVSDAGERVRFEDNAFRNLARSHGFVFEVPAHGLAKPEPLVGLGQMKHEAASVDPATGTVYLTEDHEPEAGFYRFLPAKPGELIRGGRLQMLQAVGVPDLRTGRRMGEVFKVRWVDIEFPERGRDSQGGPAGLSRQGVANGASLFTRLEGVIVGDGRVFFTSTSGGNAGCGQLWSYRPGEETLELVFESSSREVLDYPDNIILSPRGGLVICEDSEQPVQRLYGMTGGGGLFEFCRNNVVLDGFRGFDGDFREEEWAGACFSPDGKWLFANIYEPGFTVAITGPWKPGLI